MRNISLLFLLISFTGLHGQNICLEKMQANDSGFTMSLQGYYNCMPGPTADFNNDGLADFPYYAEYASAVTQQSYYFIGVVKGDSAGIFSQDISWSVTGSPRLFACGDFNEDGNADFVACGIGGSLEIYTGGGNFNFLGSGITAGATMLTGIACDDFDGDGHLDLAIAGQQTQEVINFLHGNGNGTFALPIVNYVGNHFFSKLQKGDFNNDGAVDLIYSGGILFNNGSASFTDVPMIEPAGFFAASDFNSDGSLDLIGSDSIFLGSGFGNFPSHVALALPAGTNCYGQTADLDADGNTDLLAWKGDGTFDTLLVLAGNGNATFTPAFEVPEDSLYALANTGDVDGNGTTDLIMFRSYVDFEAPMTHLYSLLNHTAIIRPTSVSLCSGDSVMLSVDNYGQISWNTGDTNSSIYVSAPGNYSVTVTASPGCATSDSILISSIAQTTFSPINSSGHFCFYASSISLTSGSPAGGNYSGAGVSNNSFDPQAAGLGTHTLYYTYTGPGGCTGTDSLQVTVDYCLAATENSATENILVYPNPVSEKITLQNDYAGSTISLFNAMGECVWSQDKNAAGQITVDVSGFPGGIYFLRLNSGPTVSTAKIVVERN